MRWERLSSARMIWNKLRRSQMTWEEIRWDEMRRAEMRWEELKWNEIKWDEMRWNATCGVRRFPCDLWTTKRRLVLYCNMSLCVSRPLTKTVRQDYVKHARTGLAAARRMQVPRMKNAIKCTTLRQLPPRFVRALLVNNVCIMGLQI